MGAGCPHERRVFAAHPCHWLSTPFITSPAKRNEQRPHPVLGEPLQGSMLARAGTGGSLVPRSHPGYSWRTLPGFSFRFCAHSRCRLRTPSVAAPAELNKNVLTLFSENPSRVRCSAHAGTGGSLVPRSHPGYSRRTLPGFSFRFSFRFSAHPCLKLCSPLLTSHFSTSHFSTSHFFTSHFFTSHFSTSHFSPPPFPPSNQAERSRRREAERRGMGLKPLTLARRRLARSTHSSARWKSPWALYTAPRLM